MKYRHIITLFLSSLWLLFLTSCGELAMPPVTGGVYYRDPDTGAKAGVKFEDGQRKPWLRVPLRDEETGQLNGVIDITAGK